MYKLVIIDDENFMRKQLVKSFPWNQLGFQVVSDFDNSNSALSYIKKNGADVLLSDIRLGNENGLDLCHEVQKYVPDIEIVLISAYSDFAYLHEAIRINVFEYLLKPVSYEMVTDCFLRLKKRIDSKMTPIVPKESETEKLLTKQFFHDLLLGIISTQEEADKRARNTHICPLPSGAFFCILSISRPFECIPENILQKYGRSGFCHALENIGSDIFGVNGFHLVNTTPNSQCAIVTLASNNVHQTNLIIDEFIAATQSLLGIRLSVSVGQISPNIFSLCTAYQKETRFFSNANSLIHQIKTYAKSGKPDLAAKLFRMSLSAQSNVSLEHTKSFALSLLTDIYSDFEEDEAAFAVYSEKITNAESSTEISSAITDFLNLWFKQTTENNHTTHYIDCAKMYMRQHFREDISLDDVASYVSLNPFYFSRYFKQHTGERYIDFLTKLRIDEAIQLLTNPENRITDIYQAIGYHSRRHFSKLFFENTGYTPSDYRKYVLKIKS